MTIFKGMPPEQALIAEMGSVTIYRYGDARQAFADINVGQNEFYVEFRGYGIRNPQSGKISSLEDGVKGFVKQPRLINLYSEDTEAYAQNIRLSSEAVTGYSQAKNLLTMDVVLHKRSRITLLSADEVAQSSPEGVLREKSPYRFPQRLPS